MGGSPPNKCTRICMNVYRRLPKQTSFWVSPRHRRLDSHNSYNVCNLFDICIQVYAFLICMYAMYLYDYTKPSINMKILILVWKIFFFLLNPRISLQELCIFKKMNKFFLINALIYAYLKSAAILRNLLLLAKIKDQTWICVKIEIISGQRFSF